MTTQPVMIMAGGTGGHIFPALAVANVLRDRNQQVVWLGSPLGLEAKIVPAAGIEIEWIPVKGLRRKGLIAWLFAPWRLINSLLSALAILRRRKPGVVLGMGGFVAGPGGIGAWVLGKPLLIHEQNAVAGLTNRILARFARQVFEAFPNSFAATVKARTIGNPVRREIASLPSPEKRMGQRTGSVRLLVLGGSQGAHALNVTLPKALAQLPMAVDVWHQAGETTLVAAQTAYHEAGMKGRVVSFIEDMSAAYGWADVVVCRAGALTIAELTAAGVGAILVPYPSAVDDHQTKNAAVMVEVGAGVLLPQDKLSVENVVSVLEPLMTDRAELLRMAVAARSISINDASEVIADACIEYLAS